MSWSISLSGKTEFLKKELESASVEIDTVLDALDEVKSESVTVNISGHGYESESGESTLSAAFSISTPPAPKPEPPSDPPSES